jgi:hypothetical protein
MIKNYDEFVNENNLHKTRVLDNPDNELEREYGEDVYESLWKWIATVMNDYRETFNDDNRLIEFIRFQLESASESMLEEGCDIDSTIKFYCR